LTSIATYRRQAHQSDGKSDGIGCGALGHFWRYRQAISPQRRPRIGINILISTDIFSKLTVFFLTVKMGVGNPSSGSQRL
jgi:hypothetical protein